MNAYRNLILSLVPDGVRIVRENGYPHATSNEIVILLKKHLLSAVPEDEQMEEALEDLPGLVESYVAAFPVITIQ